MNLNRLIGKKVRGYMDIDVTFRENITFLIGINGTGKTTILKLLSALLTPSYIDLLEIEFSEVLLYCENMGESPGREEIAAKKHGETLILSYKNALGETIKGEIQLIDHRFRDIRYDRDMIDLEKLNRTIFDFEELDVVHQIRKIKTPLFLGLSRRVADVSRFYPFAEKGDVFPIRRRTQHLDSLFDSVDTALKDIQEMFYDNVRKNAKSQYSISDLFRKKVFSESFKIERTISIPNIEYDAELERLHSRRSRLDEAIEKLDVKDLSEQFVCFFDGIKRVLEILTNTSALERDKTTNPDYVKALLEWMINYNQLERIDKIIQYANEYSNSIQSLREPIIRFVDSINLFFREGGKEIEVDERGEIKTKINGTKKTNSIFQLSSGEKQLIIILAHISFYRHRKNRGGGICIIDEPELSLHIGWQEIFVDALLRASPNTQFIIATHAPAILAKNERREWCIDLSKRI